MQEDSRVRSELEDPVAISHRNALLCGSTTTQLSCESVTPLMCVRISHTDTTCPEFLVEKVTAQDS